MNSLTKIIVAIIIIASLMAGGFYLLGQEKSGNVVNVSVDVFLDNGGNAHIVGIKGALREVNKFSLPKGNDLATPGVLANVIYKQHMIGYWTSEKLNPAAPLNSTTTYNITVGLFENPIRGDEVSLSVRLIDSMGKDLDSKLATVKI